MNELTTRITIEFAKNGFLVFLNDNYNRVETRQVPFVFETLEAMQEFIKQETKKIF
jgi:hypothetical protein